MDNLNYDEKRIKRPSLFFENEKEGSVCFYNNDGLGIGFIKKGKKADSIYNNSFSVGLVSCEKDGGFIWGGQGELLKKVGVITADGNIYYSEEKGVLSSAFNDCKVKNQNNAEKIKIGRVEASGSGAIAYDLSGNKAGEVRNAGENALIYGGGMLALVINHKETNAPYSNSIGAYLLPAPPAAAPHPKLDVLSNWGREPSEPPKPESGFKKILKFLLK